MNYSINSKQWAEFKAERQKLKDKVMNGYEYMQAVKFQNELIKETREKMGDGLIREKRRWMLFDMSQKITDRELNKVPAETIDECYKWLLDNNKIN